MSKSGTPLSEERGENAKLGFKVAEVPINFIGRERGKSKLNMKEITRFANAILKIRFRLDKLARGERNGDLSTSQGTRGIYACTKCHQIIMTMR